MVLAAANERGVKLEVSEGWTEAFVTPVDMPAALNLLMVEFIADGKPRTSVEGQTFTLRVKRPEGRLIQIRLNDRRGS